MSGIGDILAFDYSELPPARTAKKFLVNDQARFERALDKIGIKRAYHADQQFAVYVPIGIEIVVSQHLPDDEVWCEWSDGSVTLVCKLPVEAS